MQILYVLAFIAVFVLCIALLSTARRILRSSPLQSGQLSLSSIQDFDRSFDRSEDDLIEIRAVGTKISSMEDSDVEWGSDLDELPAAEEVEISEMTVAETAQVEAVPAMPAQPVSASPAEGPEDTLAVPASEQQRAFRFRKPSRRAYNYALECLLLGVSAYVLIQTQRSNMQQRLPSSSRDRVA